MEPLVRRGNRLMVEGFDPCVVCSTKRSAAGVPHFANRNRSYCRAAQPVSNRRKSNHFGRIGIARIRAPVGMDPWFLNPYFEKCGKINFQGA